MTGRWFEEFIVGQTFEHEIRRTVLEADSMWNQKDELVCSTVRQALMMKRPEEVK